MQDEEKYIVNPDEPEAMPRPFLSEDFIAETLKVGGLSKSGKPRFKWTWGCDEEIYVDNEGSKTFSSGWYLKYMLDSAPPRVVGYTWLADDGTEKFVNDLKNVPPEVLNVLPKFHIEQVGTPRWVLEEYREAGDCNGVYDRSGYYFHRWIVQDDQPDDPVTYLKPYRDPDQRDIEMIAQYVQLVNELTDEDIKRGVAEDRKREAAAKEEAKKEKHEELTDTIVQLFTDMPIEVKRMMPKPSDEVIAAARKRLDEAETKTI